MDSGPYSTHLEYSRARDECIGELDAFTPAVLRSDGKPWFAEAHRCLRDRRYMAVYCCDQAFKKKKGFRGDRRRDGFFHFARAALSKPRRSHRGRARAIANSRSPTSIVRRPEENFFLARVSITC